MSNNEDKDISEVDVVNDLVQDDDVPDVQEVQDDIPDVVQEVQNDVQDVQNDVQDDVPDVVQDVPDVPDVSDDDIPDLIPDDDVQDVVQDVVPDDDTGIFTKKIDDDCETVIIDTGHGFTVETNKSQIENIIKENKLNMFDIRITLNNINEDIEKIISDKTKVDESNFNDLCDLIALNFVYTYLKDGTKIPIL